MEEVQGMRVFLLTILHLVTKGNSETFEWISKHISTGVGTAAYNKYQSDFVNTGFNTDALKDIDEYYKEWNGFIDGSDSKYAIANNNGLQWLIAICLNEIPFGLEQRNNLTESRKLRIT